MYNVVVLIDKLERGTKESAKGSALTGLFVEGRQLKKDAEPEEWKKFLMDWNAAEAISVFEQVGVGAKVIVGMEKEGRFWNIKEVKPTAGGVAPGAPASAPAPAPASASVIAQAPATTPVITDKLLAIDRAIKLTELLLANGVIKPAKASADIVIESTLMMADKIDSYMAGTINSEPKADASDLKNNAPDPAPDDPTPDDVTF